MSGLAPNRPTSATGSRTSTSTLVPFPRCIRTSPSRWRDAKVSPSLAGAAIYSGGALSVLALIPFTPSLLPVPFGLIFGFFVLDAVVVRL